MTFPQFAATSSERRSSRRPFGRGTVAAATAAAALLAGAGSAVAAPAPAAPAAPALPQLSSSLPQIELPKEAYALADQYNVALPPFVKAPAAAPKVPAALASDLDAATTAHLSKQGHTEDAAAAGIAQEWADQAARGEVKFVDNAGDGTTHLGEGSGNVYRLNTQQAQDRLNWLRRDVPVQTSPETHPFGVATARSGDFVYLAEFFRN